MTMETDGAWAERLMSGVNFGEFGRFGGLGGLGKVLLFAATQFPLAETASLAT